MRSAALILIALAAGFAGGMAAQPRPAVAADKLDLDPADQFARGYSLVSGKTAGGMWAQRPGKGPYATVYAEDAGGKPIAAIGLARNEARATKTGLDFAVVAQDDLVWFQIVDAKGKTHFVPVTALLKLEGEAVEGGDAKAIPAPMPPRPAGRLALTR